MGTRYLNTTGKDAALSILVHGFSFNRMSQVPIDEGKGWGTYYGPAPIVGPLMHLLCGISSNPDPLHRSLISAKVLGFRNTQNSLQTGSPSSADESVQSALYHTSGPAVAQSYGVETLTDPHPDAWFDPGDRWIIVGADATAQYSTERVWGL